jgi:hypothetical protein
MGRRQNEAIPEWAPWWKCVGMKVLHCAHLAHYDLVANVCVAVTNRL